MDLKHYKESNTCNNRANVHEEYDPSEVIMIIFHLGRCAARGARSRGQRRVSLSPLSLSSPRSPPLSPAKMNAFTKAAT